MVTGSSSYTRLEQIGYVRRLADDPTASEAVRAQARDGLTQIEAGAPVNPIFQRLRNTQAEADSEQDRQLHELADEALARVHAAKTSKASKPAAPKRRPAAKDEEPARYPVRAFVLTWADLEAWWSHYDVDELAVELTDEQAEAFFATVEGTTEFADRLRTARTAAASESAARPLLRAL